MSIVKNPQKSQNHKYKWRNKNKAKRELCF